MDSHAHVETDHGRLSSHSARLLLDQTCSAGEKEPEAEARSQDFKLTFAQSTDIQIQPTVKHSRPSNLPQGMFINFLHPLNKQTGFPLTGRLKYFTSTWEKITQDPLVLQVVQGYQIEFMKPPVRLVPARMPSLTPTLETVLDQEVQELFNKEAVQLVKQPVVTEGFISSLFVVQKRTEGIAL